MYRRHASGYTSLQKNNKQTILVTSKTKIIQNKNLKRKHKTAMWHLCGMLCTEAHCSQVILNRQLLMLKSHGYGILKCHNALFFLLFTNLVPATCYWKSIRTLKKKKKRKKRL